MPRAIELLTFQNIAPGATFTAMLPLTGDSATIRNTSKPVKLLAAWQLRQGAAATGGITRITSPLLHDAVRGIQGGGNVGHEEIIYGAPAQRLYAQDILSVSGNGSATAGDIEQSSLLIGYDDLPGVDGNFLTFDQMLKKAVNRLGVRQALTASVVTGQYDGAASITATDDVLKANTDYAIMGASFENAINVTSIGIRSADWGNLRLGMPGRNNVGFRSGSWFAGLSYELGYPCIPVFNSANKGTTIVDFSYNENSSGVLGVILNLMELK